MRSISKLALVGLACAVLLVPVGCGGSDSGNTEDLDAGDDTAIDDSAATETSSTDDSSTDDGSTGDSTSSDSTSGDGSSDSGGTAGDSGKTDGAATDSSGTGDSGGTTDAKSDTPVGSLPTITIALPTAAQIIAFDPKSDACQGQLFTVSYSAPLGFAEMKWKFITPNASSGVTGTCDGSAAYGYFMQQDKYVGTKSGTLSEDVSVGGLFSDATSNGRWWWCTRPGTAAKAFASLSSPTTTAPSAPGSPGYQTLSNYCYSNTKGGIPTDAAQQWTFEVTLKDAGGNTVVATRKFWIHN